MAKIGHHAKSMASAKWQVWVENIKIHKNMRKTTLQSRQSCSVQKTAQKNNKYSKNDRFWKIARIGHYAKVIAFGKWSVWVEN